MSNQNTSTNTTIVCGTTLGQDIEFTLYQEWSPLGYDRALELWAGGFYDHSHFFRVVPNFLVQFGISYLPASHPLQKLAHAPIQDDPPLQIPFEKGTISFAGSGPNSRTSQLFFSYSHNPNLGKSPWETPIGKVTEKSMNDVVDKLYSQYGDMPPWGHGPVQGKISNEGMAYIEREFPLLDAFTTCHIKDEQTNSTTSSRIQASIEKNPVKLAFAVLTGFLLLVRCFCIPPRGPLKKLQ